MFAKQHFKVLSHSVNLPTYKNTIFSGSKRAELSEEPPQLGKGNPRVTRKVKVYLGQVNHGLFMQLPKWQVD